MVLILIQQCFPSTFYALTSFQVWSFLFRSFLKHIMMALFSHLFPHRFFIWFFAKLEQQKYREQRMHTKERKWWCLKRYVYRIIKRYNISKPAVYDVQRGAEYFSVSSHSINEFPTLFNREGFLLFCVLPCFLMFPQHFARWWCFQAIFQHTSEMMLLSSLLLVLLFILVTFNSSCIWTTKAMIYGGESVTKTDFRAILIPSIQFQTLFPTYYDQICLLAKALKYLFKQLLFNPYSAPVEALIPSL